MVLFHSPTKLSVSLEAFDQLNLDSCASRWTHDGQCEIRYSRSLKRYRIPISLIHVLRALDNLQYPWYAATVQDCLLNIEAIPNLERAVERYETCTTEQTENAFPSSMRHQNFPLCMLTQRKSYIYAPYDCKVPPLIAGPIWRKLLTIFKKQHSQREKL